jgi:hypothetical protein
MVIVRPLTVNVAGAGQLPDPIEVDERDTGTAKVVRGSGVGAAPYSEQPIDLGYLSQSVLESAGGVVAAGGALLVVTVVVEPSVFVVVVVVFSVKEKDCGDVWVAVVVVVLVWTRPSGVTVCLGADV